MIPSNTIRGSVLPFMEPIPLTVIEASEPGCPFAPVSLIPGVEPFKVLSGLVDGLNSSLSLPIFPADPVKEAFVAVPYATTITSSSS